ncbi:MAG: hypothetical protein HYX63_05910 [Gammaproteobacteria bacterium]|nr:hypothetical protein [Gammaproteobacteria bacterium]
MPRARFYVANILPALVWAPTYILPGVVFGAARGLAGAVAKRLALMIVFLIGIPLAAGWIVRHSFVWLRLRLKHRFVQLQT